MMTKRKRKKKKRPNGTLSFSLEFLADERKSGAQGVSDEPYRLMEGGRERW